MENKDIPIKLMFGQLE